MELGNHIVVHSGYFPVITVDSWLLFIHSANYLIFYISQHNILCSLGYKCRLQELSILKKGRRAKDLLRIAHVCITSRVISHVGI